MSFVHQVCHSNWMFSPFNTWQGIYIENDHSLTVPPTEQAFVEQGV